MALDLTGISNENEYYTHHYLSAILEQDLKGVFGRWVEDKERKGVEPPNIKLLALRNKFFTVRKRLERAKTAEEILAAQHKFIPELLQALGYEFQPQSIELNSGMSIPVIAEIRRATGEPLLWILESLSAVAETEDPLIGMLKKCQYGAVGDDAMILDEELSEIVTRRIFTETEPPRWVIVVGYDSIVLLDRSKWNEKRLLRFDVHELLSRKEESSLRAVAALLHRDSVCPAEGASLLDTLGENSHKHAFSVSNELKYSAREAVELIGNEAVWYLRNVRKEAVFGSALDAQQLTSESLRYLYRLLFLFYVEARPELQYVPMKSDAYRLGYSLESLRDLELVKLTTDESKNGYYLHESLEILFEKIFNGYNHGKFVQGELGEPEAPMAHTFVLHPLNSHLFNPENTQILNRVKFRNSTLQKVIELLSLSRVQGNNKRRGRISYAQLGINQLGAVYEGLLSYSGFFAQEDLYEVKKADAPYNELDAAYFVKAQDLTKYNENEKVYNDNGTLKKFVKGTYIYRLSGRSREKSASYYTPEVLTQCLVKYAMKELLKDKTADQILNLKVCERALGSGAFANEAVNQLAEAYLLLKQREMGVTIGHDEYAIEKQKVKMYIADNNVFGVDLNPVAVELAEISLWLNTIYEGAQIPWFGMQLVTGNSLVGARRQIFDSSLLMRRIKGDQTWLACVPERVRLSEERKVNSVYHFLLPDNGMADYNDKVVKELAKTEIQKIKNWRKQFITPFTAGEIRTLERLSAAIDRLWMKHALMQKKIRQRTTDMFPVFGQIFDLTTHPTTTHQKDDIFRQEFLSVNVRNSSPYRRLKLAMDYWCALWFWPIEKAQLLPSRDEYLLELTALLEGGVYEATPVAGDQIPLFASTASAVEQKELLDEFGFVDVDALCRNFPRLHLVAELSQKYRYHHWELEYADIFLDNGGFDLIVGNPPWIKIEWNEGGLLSDYDPLFLLRQLSASDVAKKRQETIDKRNIKNEYLGEFVEQVGLQNYFNSKLNFPSLEGTQSNLYKCFLPHAWMLGSGSGISGFLHPDGVYDDPNGGKLRREIYPRLLLHFQFQNEYKLFSDVHNETIFSINIYRSKFSNVHFLHVSNLFLPSTLEQCFGESPSRTVGGIKDEKNCWNVLGHPDRLIEIDIKLLELFGYLYDEPGTSSLSARLPVVHAHQVVGVLQKFANPETKVSTLDDQYVTTVMWDETGRVKDSTIKRETKFPHSTMDWVISGPHLYVGKVFHQTPRNICDTNRAYDNIDLEEIPDSYLPRTNYVPACDNISFQNRQPVVPWEGNSRLTEFYRLVFRAMLSQFGERTLVGGIAPIGCTHINGIQSTAFKNNNLLLSITSFCMSLVADFFIKTTGRGNLHHSWETFPLVSLPKRAKLNCLSLNCITTHYSNLWAESWDVTFLNESWTKVDPRLDNGFFTRLTSHWQRNCTLRSDYARRQALVEIDVLFAQTLCLTLEELCTIYRIQFPVLRQNENDTWYDRKGRIVFTCSKGLPGVGFSRPEWNEIKDMQSGTVERTVTEDFLPGGPRVRTIVYEAPFDRCDREVDYTTAWKVFEERMKS